MSMKLGYDLTIEQAQKLVMTPELIQAIQILQFNTQELDAYVEEQLLVNPVLEHSAAEVSNEDSRGDHEESFRDAQNQEKTAADSDRDDFDWKEYIRGSTTTSATSRESIRRTRKKTTRWNATFLPM